MSEGSTSPIVTPETLVVSDDMQPLVQYAKGHIVPYYGPQVRLAVVKMLVSYRGFGKIDHPVSDQDVVTVLLMLLEHLKTRDRLFICRRFEDLLFGNFFTRDLSVTERFVETVCTIVADMVVMGKGNTRLLEFGTPDPKLKQEIEAAVKSLPLSGREADKKE